MKTEKIKDLVIAIKGAGEMATGTACRLFNANFKRIFMMEVQNPVAVRRKVSFCETIYDGTTSVEGITAIKISDTADIQTAWDTNQIPVMVDPDWHTIKALSPHVVIDAIIAK